MEMRDILAALAMKYNGELLPLLQALERQEQVNDTMFSSFKSKLKYNYVTIIDENYPELLKHVENPPIVLFYKGNLDLINPDRQILAKISEEGVRMLHVVNPELTPKGIKMDYVMACECHDDMDMLMERMRIAQKDLIDYIDMEKRHVKKENYIH